MEKKNTRCTRYLRGIFVFSKLSEEDLGKVAAIVKTKEYSKNSVIFREGETGEGLFFVIKGKIKLSKLTEEGKEKILHFCQEGDVFAEILLFDGGSYPATAETIEDAEIGLIRHDDLEQLLRGNNEITMKILKVMAKRLREAQLQVRDLAFKDAYGRLASALLHLSEEYGGKIAGASRTGMNLNQQELANVIGSSRETVARILGEWRKDGIISIEKREIFILDKGKLEIYL